MSERDPDQRVERLRRRARERWGRADDDADELLAELDSDDPEARARAAWSLAELAADDPDRSRRVPVESDLAPLLSDDDRWVRRGASWALATVAEECPRRARAAVPEVAESLGDDDPLVRENGVLALAAVGRENPRAVEPALSRLADLARDDDGLARRYAAETLRRLVTRIEEDGFPETIEAAPDVADLLPGGADVVDVTDDPSEGRPLRIRGGTGGAPEESGGGDEDEEPDALGPPAEVPSPPEIGADRRAFERLADLGGDPLLAAEKARAPAAAEGNQPVAVALRTLRPDAEADPGRVETGLRAWAGVDDHDHVAPVLARGSDPRPWVATEFFDGGTLRDRLGAVGFDRALWYAHCVAAAVCHAHARGVVHGALRPGSVGLSRTLGAWPVPKVADWGLGECLRAVRTPPVPPAFAAPEHLAPERFGRPDQSTDVYQLGALCYALVADRPPFVGDPEAAVRKVRREEPAPPSEFADGIPPAVDDLLGRALTKEKPARFETAEDFRRELEVVIREVPTSFEL